MPNGAKQLFQSPGSALPEYHGLEPDPILSRSTPLPLTGRFPLRVLAQLRLALLSDVAGAATRAALETVAREAGLTGAQIDAAHAGRSFEARTAATLSLACAIKSGKADQISVARAKAQRLGLSENDLEAIALEVTAILAERAP